jgi:hypothetical protein
VRKRTTQRLSVRIREREVGPEAALEERGDVKHEGEWIGLGRENCGASVRERARRTTRGAAATQRTLVVWAW